MKPCPWCHSTHISLESHKENDNGNLTWYAHAECQECDAQGPIANDEDRLEAMGKAQARWDHPKPDPPKIQTIREDQDPRDDNHLFIPFLQKAKDSTIVLVIVSFMIIYIFLMILQNL